MNRLHDSKKAHDYARGVGKEIIAKLHSLFCFLKSSKKTVLLVAIVAIISIASTSLISVMLSVYDDDIYLPSLGTIKTIEVEAYWDPNGENKRESLSWNEIEPGETQTTTVYIQSISNVKISLNITLTDWNPPQISDYLTISPDYNGALLNPGEIIPVTMSLSASSSNAFTHYLVDNEIRGFEVVIHFVGSE